MGRHANSNNVVTTTIDTMSIGYEMSFQII